MANENIHLGNGGQGNTIPFASFTFIILGTSSKPIDEYKYLDRRCRHYKLIDEGHGTGPSHPVVQSVIREMVLGAQLDIIIIINNTNSKKIN